MGGNIKRKSTDNGIYSQKDYYVCDSASMGEFIPAVV